MKNPVVLKFSFQPIIENAIFYGIFPLQDADGRIDIKIYLKNDELIIKISDYGVKLPKNDIDELNKKINNDSIASKHIGLNNVNRIIKLAFTEKYGIRLASDGIETSVIFLLPYNTAEQFPST